MLTSASWWTGSRTNIHNSVIYIQEKYIEDIFEFAMEFLELLINIDGIFGNSDQEQQSF